MEDYQRLSGFYALSRNSTKRKDDALHIFDRILKLLTQKSDRIQKIFFAVCEVVLDKAV